MKRRAFITLLGGTVIGWPPAGSTRMRHLHPVPGQRRSPKSSSFPFLSEALPGENGASHCKFRIRFEGPRMPIAAGCEVTDCRGIA